MAPERGWGWSKGCQALPSVPWLVDPAAPGEGL